ncbi:uncharacterized protein C3orf20 homolog [Spea bombifrons]|uniref:uncharacterized protein C3orf20 homolog n=1 Tax=Spea bombifrons TaxID=233779 RepID=UPI00234ABC01|nr:uncharacterized protein C3orf20 homolog [Spea bombifrons]
MMTDKEGEIVKEWQWPLKGKLPDPITLQVNEHLSVRILGQFAISLIYKWQHETVRLSLSPLLDVSPPQIEELGQLLTNEHFSSRTAKELSKAHRKKGKEKDTKKSSKKATMLSELAKTLEIPENPVCALSDFNAASELRKLQRKVRNIVDDWMEHYRLASGVDSPHIKKMPKAPPRMAHKRKIHSAAVFPVTSNPPESKPFQQTDAASAPVSDGHLLHGRFQSAPIQSLIRRWGTPQSSPSPRPSSLRSVKKDQTTAESSRGMNTSGLLIVSKSGIPVDTSGPLLSIEHDSEKLWHMSNQACPVIIRNVMLGEEGRLCRCSNYQIPYVTDLEYDQLINKTSHTDQITVVCVVSSSTLEDNHSRDMLDQLYEKKNRYRSMPCMQSRLDSFRLLKYDISSSNELTGRKNSLLVQRHNVTPGMVLMYIQGKLLFANYIFNGYSRSIKDLQKQIAQTRSDYQMGLSLPKDFKFSYKGQQQGQEKTIC